MKLYLFGAAAAALIAPAAAAAETNAVIGAQYTSIDYSGFDWDDYGLNGGVTHDFGNGAVLQVDGEIGRADIGGSCCLGMSYGAAHYGMRNEDYGFAGFVGFTDYFGISGAEVGVEGQWFLPNVAFNGSVAYVDFSDYDLSAANIGVDGAWFITPNFALTGLVTFTDVEYGGGGDYEETTWGVGGEWRFDGSPASVVFGYRGLDVDGFDGDAWTIGVNIDLGSGSLQERATSGPSFSGASLLHGALRMGAT